MEVTYILYISITIISWTAAAVMLYKSVTMLDETPPGIVPAKLYAIYLLLNIGMVLVAMNVFGVFEFVYFAAELCKFILIYVFLAHTITLVAGGEQDCILSVTYYVCWFLLCVSTSFYIVYVIKRAFDSWSQGVFEVLEGAGITLCVFCAVVYLVISVHVYKKLHVCLYTRYKILSLFFLCEICGSALYAGVLDVTQTMPYEWKDVIQYAAAAVETVLPGLLLLILMNDELKEIKVSLLQQQLQIPADAFIVGNLPDGNAAGQRPELE
ncbi:MAG: hypothetical protein P4M11_14860 [Candidatus Pacebacteria bacterium]|nr:hypothetical protein [Candidatus Paceibacterota bacterium]